MSLSERIAIYEEIEKARGRPLVVYVTSDRKGPHAGGRMSGDVIPELLDQLTALPPKANSVDLLVVSSGGDPTVAWRAMSLLRERCAQVAILVPQAAYSAATLLALGADEIIMHPHGNFGPVDPQIQVVKKTAGSEEVLHIKFGYEDLAGFIEFARENVGLTDQEHLKSLLQQFCGEVGPVPVGIAARSSRLSLQMGQQLLQMHMTKDSDSQKVQAIAEALNKRYFHHGYPVSRKEAKEIGLKIAKPNVDLENAIWSVWVDIEADLQMREPFSPAARVAAHPDASGIFQPPPTINIPSNIPPQVAGQIAQGVLTQVQIHQPPAVDFKIVNVIMESRRHASRHETEGKILAFRSPDGQVKINVIPTRFGWQKVDLPSTVT